MNTFSADSYSFDQNNPKGISSSKITKIIEDKSGNVWIGTDIGLNKFDKNKIISNIILFQMDYLATT